MRASALCLALLSGMAFGADETVEQRRAQLERLRGEIADQVQLRTYDLLDELVYGWNEAPPFTSPTPLILADVSVPVGMGSGLRALIENHFVALLAKNPRAGVVLSHCPQCTSVVVHSGAKGTVVARGIDEPEALAQAGAGSGSKHALFLDFEAEGSALVLRARITSLEPASPIVYAKTLSSSTGSAALLRDPEHLKSAPEARQEYLDALTGRSVFTFPVRLGIRSYATPPEVFTFPPSNTPQISLPPFVWLNVGVETSFTQSRAWLASVSLGASWAPELHIGWTVQARLARLLTGSSSSLTAPDLYFFVGGGVISLHGQTASTFQTTIPNIEDLFADNEGADPHIAFATFQLGLELRIKNRIGLAVFAEGAPWLNFAPAAGKFVSLDFLSIHTLGVEVSFCF